MSRHFVKRIRITRRLLALTLLLAACGGDAASERADDPATGDSIADSTATTSGNRYVPPPTDCTDELVASIELTIVDAETQEPVRGAIAWVSDGTRVDTLTSGDGFAAAMWERAGTYDVHVEHPSYTTWTEPGIVVSQGPCHVTTQTRRVLMQPLR